MLGLTACGSGGGGNANANSNDAAAPTKTAPTTKIEMEKLPGQARYSAILDKNSSSVMGDPRSGTVNLIADFTKNNIVGEVNFDPSANYSREKTGSTRQCGTYQSCTPYKSSGNYANLELKNTTLVNNDGVLSFNGEASGKLYNNSRGTKRGGSYYDSDGINIVGSYEGRISGSQGEVISGKLNAKSPTDTRYTVNGVFNGEKVSEIQREKPAETVTTSTVEPTKPAETVITPTVEPTKPAETVTTPTVEPSKPSETITVPTVNTPTENMPKETVWDTLPAVPTIETSSVTGNRIDVKGQATYFGKDANADFRSKDISGKSRNDKDSYIVLNADFDKKNISGSSAFNLYTFSNGVALNKVGQVELQFKDATLYKRNYTLAFSGDSEGKLQTENTKVDLSGSYSGRTEYYGVDSLSIEYNLNSEKDNSISVKGSQYIYKQ